MNSSRTGDNSMHATSGGGGAETAPCAISAEQLREEIVGLKKELRCCDDYEQRALLRLDLATAMAALVKLLPEKSQS